MKDYIGLWVLDEPIYCNKDVSGKHFQSNIAGLNISFYFPSCPETYNAIESLYNNNDLIPPFNVNFLAKELNWGKIHAWPDKLFSVNVLLCSLKCEENDIQNIYSDFPRWKQKFNNLLLISSGNYMQPEQKPLSFSPIEIYDGISFITQSDNEPITKFVMNNQISTSIQIPIVTNRNCHDAVTMQMLFENAGSSKEIALPYELLMVAYKAVFRHDFRSAVIIAATALEKSIMNRIQHHYDYNQLDTFEDDKTNVRYNALGGKFKWLRDLRITIPVQNYKTYILGIRNPTVHEGHLPSYKDTKKYLDNCKTIIQEYSPNVLEE